MAIFGAGSTWDEEEVCDTFFDEGKYTIGWNRVAGADLQASLASLKIGDIIYLKSNRPGSRNIRVKGIGLVSKSFIECVQSGEYPAGSIGDWQSFFILVEWLVTEEFMIEIPKGEGKLTNIRAATFYEEPLPFVQSIIVQKIATA